LEAKNNIKANFIDIEVKMCVGFINSQKPLDSVNWTKLMQILKRNDIDRSEKIFISILYMDQIAEVRLKQAETRKVKILR
jgi:hypothetical protein